MTGYENPNCDAADGTCTYGAVKRYPISSRDQSAAILCMHHWAVENQYAYNRGRETGHPEEWPQHDWFTTPEYRAA